MSNENSIPSQRTVEQIVLGFERLPPRQQSLAHLIIDHPELAIPPRPRGPPAPSARFATFTLAMSRARMKTSPG
jgi:hypothetical protein